METTVKNLSDTKVQVTITLGAAELAEAEQIALTKLSKTTKVPGFREGKVPAGVAAKHVNPQSLQEQTLDDAISKAVAESFTKEGIRAIDRPAVDVKKYVPGEQLEFVAEVEVLPKITLGDYKKLTTKPEKVTVPAKEITDVLERMRQGYAEKKEVERAAKDGDEVLIDFVGKKDDVAFDGGTASDYTLSLGAGQFIPGFEEGIIGHAAGETFDLDLAFPKEYHSAELAGQKVVFTVTLKKVLEPELPALDDELAKKTGQFESLAELKDDIKRELTKQREQATQDTYKDALITELIEKSNVPVPEVLIEDQMRSIEQDFQQNLMYRGMTIDGYIQSQGYKDVDEWREKELKTAATRRVQAGLVLAEVTKAENLTLTEEEIDEHVELHKQQYANNPEMVKQLESAEARQDIANHFLTEKTIERLISLNK
ncbi:trigger factor [Candidatus Saccharibacteria bacterium]|nr:trigger factor [Candidatus Saccharibacteria bacterium]MBJ58515.1 trigger factor [Candidatus Saccharibacteria bacterium]MBQ69351.1 trigger factor [Candidatus Saccharibacteria bacterium]|tara:strand:- start:134 stop:1417 length:1284 start_codon:yes stop_codon:yes gene_type:complete